MRGKIQAKGSVRCAVPTELLSLFSESRGSPLTRIPFLSELKNEKSSFQEFIPNFGE